MIRTLAVASLRRHPARTALAILGVAVAGALLLDMVMLGSGMRESFRRFLLVQNFQLRIAPKGTLPMDTEATIDSAGAILRTLRTNPDIVAVTPVLGAQIHVLQGTRALTSFAVGIDPSTEADYQLETGANVGFPDRIVANAAFLRVMHVAIGDTVDAVTGFDPQLRTYWAGANSSSSGRGASSIRAPSSRSRRCRWRRCRRWAGRSAPTGCRWSWRGSGIARTPTPRPRGSIARYRA